MSQQKFDLMCRRYGIYNSFLCKVGLKRKLNICLETALRIKKSSGILRGKNEAEDAVRIAEYALKHFSELGSGVHYARF